MAIPEFNNTHELIQHLLSRPNAVQKRNALPMEIINQALTYVPVKYEFKKVQQSLGVRIKSVVLNILTFGAWGSIKKGSLELALKRGDLKTAEQLIESGSCRYLSQEKFFELIESNQLAAALFNAAQEMEELISQYSQYQSYGFYGLYSQITQRINSLNSSDPKIIRYIRALNFFECEGRKSPVAINCVNPADYSNIRNLVFGAYRGNPDAAKKMVLMESEGISMRDLPLPQGFDTNYFQWHGAPAGGSLRYYDLLIDHYGWGVNEEKPVICRDMQTHTVSLLVKAFMADDVDSFKHLLEKKGADPKTLVKFFQLQYSKEFFPDRCVAYLLETSRYNEAVDLFFRAYMRSKTFTHERIRLFEGHISDENLRLLQKHRRLEQWEANMRIKKERVFKEEVGI